MTKSTHIKNGILIKKERKTMRSFRLRPDTIKKLLLLSQREGKSQAKIIEEVIDKLK